MSETNIGKIKQIIGPTVDVEFHSDKLPQIYNAIHIENKHGQTLGFGVSGQSSRPCLASTVRPTSPKPNV